MMGMGATNEIARIAASLGRLNGVGIEFQACADVPYGGVLLALPALIASGLLQHTEEHFRLPKGYYTVKSIFMLIAFMALARIKVMESLRYCAPGEWGKLLGIDRIPEVKILRNKIRTLSEGGSSEGWSAQLCSDWMESSGDSEYAGYYYVDGHVRVYSGSRTLLPKHYVARQRLCLRATIDYWVNAMDGQPFFLINKAIDPGLLSVLKNDIVPRLEQEVQHQPTEEQLRQNPQLHRFTLVFDREGYSPHFLKAMKEKRIACITYNKHNQNDWQECEFVGVQVKLVMGEIVTMKLAERGVQLRNRLWVREIRKLTDTGHQTSILATDYVSDLKPVATAMFARWCQEAFFKYMRIHYNLDRLLTYAVDDIPDTTRIVNPEYKRIDGVIRNANAIRNRKLKEFGSILFKGEINTYNSEAYYHDKAVLQEEISLLEKTIEESKTERKHTPRHIPIKELSEHQRFNKLSMHSKYFIDTIKMIAYRAETSMAHILRDNMAHTDEARRLLQAVYTTNVDLIPNKEQKTLTVRLHHLANHSTDSALQNLCDHLNDTCTVFPDTDLRLIYEISP
jgi:hypothetical protein